MTCICRSKVREKKDGFLSGRMKDEAFWDQGVRYFVDGNNKQAVLMFNKAVQASPKDAKSYYMRGEAYAGLGDKIKALEDFNKAIRLEKSNANAFHSRGEVYLEMGDFRRAIQDFNRSMRIDPDFLAFTILAGRHFLKWERWLMRWRIFREH